ncbi:hypothetical protein ACLOJK_041452, partial [Asimina triloba]
MGWALMNKKGKGKLKKEEWRQVDCSDLLLNRNPGAQGEARGEVALTVSRHDQLE